MLRQSIRSSQSIALGFALCVVAAGATGCGTSDSTSSGDDEQVVAPAGVKNVRVSAADIQGLAAGDFYKVDLSGEKVVYRFDYSDAAINYDRIQLVTPRGEPTLLSAEMKIVQEGDYGDYPQPNLLGASDKRFSVAMHEADFGVLKQSELDTLKNSGTGFFYSESALEAKAGPQSIDDGCIHAVCEFCFENGTSSPPISWQPGTYHCYYEEHVWCD